MDTALKPGDQMSNVRRQDINPPHQSRQNDQVSNQLAEIQNNAVDEHDLTVWKSYKFWGYRRKDIA